MTGATLLLLEDDPAIARTVAYAFEREGFVVHHVLLVREAAQRLSEPRHPYAAAIFDVGLPDGSGLELCRQLRQAGGQGASLPIVLLTARSEELDRVLGLELGADDYLTKPFSPRELVARLRALLRRAALPAAGAAPTAPEPALVHDEASHRVRRGQAWLPLTRLELGLMQVLLRHPGRIWPRDALLDAVWGQGADSSDRTVDTHIKTLRAKLREACGGLDPIVTHRGLGYALDLNLLDRPDRSHP